MRAAERIYSSHTLSAMQEIYLKLLKLTSLQHKSPAPQLNSCELLFFLSLGASSLGPPDRRVNAVEFCCWTLHT